MNWLVKVATPISWLHKRPLNWILVRGDSGGKR
jgi:hypothetical protein